MHAPRLLIYAPAALGIGCEILAQAGIGAVDPGLTSLIGNGVTIAVLAWYVVYDVRVRSPQQQTAFAAEIGRILSTFQTEQEANRKTFQAEQNANRTMFTSELAAMRIQHNNELTEYRQLLRESMVAFRTAVHDVRETAQGVVSAVDEIKLRQGGK